MELTLAIPVHNDHQDLRRLLKRVGRLRLAEHVIVVDDGSDTRVCANSLLADSGLKAEQLTLLRHDTARGAGAARNLALDSVTTDHILFLDADDLPTRELLHLLTDLDSQVFDFCIFQHHDTRMDRLGRWGQMPDDQAHWIKAGINVGSLSLVSRHAAAHLCRTANYPWNKIYRTAFLTENRIRCSEIQVHNDIELHWKSFIQSTRVLASDRIGIVHFVSKDGNRLTNRYGPERLEVFVALERVADEISSHGVQLYALPFFRFAMGLFDWINGNLLAEFQNQFSRLVSNFIQTHMPQAIQEYIAWDDPALFARVLSYSMQPVADQTGG